MKLKYSFFNSNTYFFKSILILFFLTRIILFYILGYNNIPDFFHYSHIELLEHDLIETVIYSHSQPPLLNLFIGTLLKIFKGNLTFFSIFFYFFNTSLTIGILYLSFKKLNIFQINKKYIFFILVFLVLNPNFIYYENYSNPLYSHVICFLFFQLTYLIFKYYFDKNELTEFYVYFTILISSFIWPPWQPYLIPLVFVLFKFFVKKINLKSFIIFSIVFSISLIPSIKNKILFGVFSNSTWTGIYLSTAFVPEPSCAQLDYDTYGPWELEGENQMKDFEYVKKKYPEEYFSKPSLWGPMSIENNLIFIGKSKRCLSYAVNRILNDPFDYLYHRTVQFIVSHSKFSFENVRGASEVGKPRWIIKYLDIFDNKFERFKQIIIFSYMMTVYLGSFLFIVSQYKSKNKFALPNAIFFFIYIYYVSVTHLPGGSYENTRMVYGGFVIQIIFLANLINFVNKLKKK